jgi:hypothetical protein
MVLLVACPWGVGGQGAIEAQERFQWDFGPHLVHASAVRTDFLPPSVAQRKGVVRSGHRGMLNVVVEEKRADGLHHPIEARVEARATNLLGQVIDIPIEPHRDGEALYHVGTFALDHRPTLDFHIEVQPPGVSEPYVVEFQKEFVTPDPPT